MKSGIKNFCAAKNMNVTKELQATVSKRGKDNRLYKRSLGSPFLEVLKEKLEKHLSGLLSFSEQGLHGIN